MQVYMDMAMYPNNYTHLIYLDENKKGYMINYYTQKVINLANMMDPL